MWPFALWKKKGNIWYICGEVAKVLKKASFVTQNLRGPHAHTSSEHPSSESGTSDVAAHLCQSSQDYCWGPKIREDNMAPTCSFVRQNKNKGHSLFSRAVLAQIDYDGPIQ